MTEKQDKLIIIHHSEIALKKGNRSFFESRLRLNIRKAVSDLHGVRVKIEYGRFFVWVDEHTDLDVVLQRLQHVIGIASIRVAYPGDPDPHVLKEQVFEKVKDLEFDSFRVDTRRADKQFPYNSVQINQIVGGRIHTALGKRVDLKNGELVIHIEIFNQRVFFSTSTLAGERGLPVGSTGKVLSLLSSGIDSPVSSYMMMKRGTQVIFVHFHSFPFTEKSSYYNAIELTKKLTRYQYNSKVYMVPLATLQQEIILATPPKLRVILYRRMMLRLAERIAKRERCRALVTGDSLGQVASQTLENIAAISQSVTLPIFRPLVGMEKNQIIDVAREIGTYKTSTEPYDDCCSYLVPPKPETKAKLNEVLEAEDKMEDWQGLIRSALEESEVLRFEFPSE